MNERQSNNLVVTIVTVTNLLVAFFISGIVIWSLGEDPWFALKTMLYGAFGYEEGLGYTLYYTTNFILVCSISEQKDRPILVDLRLDCFACGWKTGRFGWFFR